MIWKQLIQKGAERFGKAIQKYRQRQAARQKQTPEKPQGKHKGKEKEQQQKEVSQQEQAAKDKAKEKAQADALKVQEKLKEKGGGSYPVKEVDSHDGSRPSTPTTGSGNSNGGGDYDPPREPPRSSYRGKSKDNGRSL